MDKFTVFDDRNNALLLFYNINSPICILLNLLAIYLIVFKSSREMREYRWYLLYYQIWVSALDVHLNVLFQPVTFLPINAVAGHGFLITKIGFSTSTCVHVLVLLVWGLLSSILALFFYRHQCIVEKQYKVSHRKFIFYIIVFLCIVFCSETVAFQLCKINPSLWPELLRKKNPEAMELLKISNIYYMPPSFMYNIFFLIAMLFNSFLVLLALGLIFHMQYIFRKQYTHLTVHTRELQNKFLRAQIIQVTIPFVLLFVPLICFSLRAIDGSLGLQILKDVLTMMLSAYGVVATLFLISFNTPYREFLSGKVREFGILKNGKHETKIFSENIGSSSFRSSN